MRPRRYRCVGAVVGVFLWLSLIPLKGQIPQLINYQGRISVAGTNFDGMGQFKFALVSNTNFNLWSNDGTLGFNLEPAGAVSLEVSKGLYSVLLGDATLPNMVVIPATIFNNSNVRLRVWFNDGTNGFQQLDPDQRIAAVGYALMSNTVIDSAITTPKLADGAVSNAKLETTLASDLARKSASQVFAGANTFSNAGNSFSGIGSGLTGLNAANLSSGTLPDARLSANVVMANTTQTIAGAKTLSSTSNQFTGNGSGLSSLNASNVTTGTLPDARLSSNIAVRSGANTFSGVNTFNNLGNQFTGNGSGLIQLNASAINSGTLLDARLTSNVPLLTSGNLGLGTSAPGERLEVNGSDATVRIRNSNDAIGGFIGDSYGTLQIGMYNPSALEVGEIPANTKRSFFGIDGITGKVGTLTNNFLSPQFQVVLDDGFGHMDFPDTQTQKITLAGPSYGIGVQFNAVYHRSPGSFQWFRGGVHDNGEGDAGAGGTRLMRLRDNGNLEFNNMPGIHFSQEAERQSPPYFNITEGTEATVDELSIRCPAAGFVVVMAMIDASGGPGHLSLYNVTSGSVLLASQPTDDFKRGSSFSWVIPVPSAMYINLKTTAVCVDDLNPATTFVTSVLEHNLTALYFPVRYM